MFMNFVVDLVPAGVVVACNPIQRRQRLTTFSSTNFDEHILH